MSLRTGASKQEISPDDPLFLVGYPHVPRISTGIHDPLFASALYLANEKTHLILISVDVLFISSESTDFCRFGIARETGVSVENILISATHTHSAPVTVGMLAWLDDPVVPAADYRYMERFHDGIIKAAIEAFKKARPAELAVTTAVVEGVGSNRLSPDGPMDRTLGIIAIRSAGEIVAANLFYGMHPTVLHEDSTLVSSDFCHFTREEISQAFPGITLIYHNSPSGNLSPRYHVRGQTFEEAERLGRKLGSFAVEALEKLTDAQFKSDLTLSAKRSHAEMVPNHFPSVLEAARALGEAQEHFEKLKREAAPHGPLRTAECVVFGCEEGLTLAKAQAGGEAARWQNKYRMAEIQVLRIGALFIVGWPGEQFVEYALQIKTAAPLKTFIATLANGEVQGYIVTPEAQKQLCYEAKFSLFTAESGQAMVDTTLSLMKDLAV